MNESLMPCLDTATCRSCTRNHTITPRVWPLFSGNTSDISAFGLKKRWASALKLYIQMPRERTLNSWRHNGQDGLLVKAVATFETTFVMQSIDIPAQDDHLQLGSTSSSQLYQLPDEGTDDLGQREKLRRMRISKANKGNVPWNKGRKHSAETLRRIKERTKLAMQDPKVKMKLMNIGHAQSEETRHKISLGVRMGWQRRREKLMVQEICCFEWQNLIAEASRKGSLGEDELQWDSYEILDERLKEQWQESVEMRKSMPRPKGSRRAPKSPEQRRKISEAISAKWADPDYRNRVCSALAIYHGITPGTERKSRRKPSGDTEKKKASEKPSGRRSDGKSVGKARSRMKVAATPSYKDPLASSKFEMIKKIRAQRATMETRKREATERARLLIAEAEKAAQALEHAALTSPLARASLIETRELIAEAIRSLEGIDSVPHTSSESSSEISFSSESNEVKNLYIEVSKPTSTNMGSGGKVINGTSHPHVREIDHEEFRPDDFELQNLRHGREPTGVGKQMGAIQTGESNLEEKPQNRFSKSSQINSEVGLRISDGSSEDEKVSASVDTCGDAVEKKRKIQNAARTKKKWVCGRLVEVEEEEEE